ncbi:MAG: ornithine cyclodeaminase family protein [Pirellula sp.]|jgi:ornithine cyclodeaminase/alanine dehydrogenase|nr:ornithine cyclodeaminase family protein [Pirellula sp.]
MKAIDVLLLSRADILSLALTPADVVEVVTLALQEHAAGTVEMHPKIGVHPTGTDPANFIHAMPAYLHKLNACGLKWVAGFAKNYQRDLPNVSGIQVYNDTETGIPLAIMDCGYLTGLRTAAVSAIAAREGARRGAETLALVGCGFEGTMHLRFITHEIPAIRQVRLRDIRPQAMAQLKETASEYFSGDIQVCPDDGTCLVGADVISTCTNGEDQLIQAQWFKPGAVAVGIEGGCAFTAEALHSADKFIVDDIPLAEYFDKIGRDRVTEDGRPDPEFPGGMPEVYATIGELVTGRKKGREHADERIVATPIGMSICDIALAHLAYETAIKKGCGQIFRLA